MDFPWMEVAKAAAPLAPMVGGILGGFIPFPGASVVGQGLGQIIAKQFGVPDGSPSQVAAAIAAAPPDIAVVKLQAAVEEAKAKYPAIAQIEAAYAHLAETQITQVNETMRAELTVDSPFKTWWRPAHGWELLGMTVIFGLILFTGLVLAGFGNKLILTAISENWTFIFGYLCLLAAVVGVAVLQPKNEALKTSVVTTAPLVSPAPQKALSAKPKK